MYKKIFTILFVMHTGCVAHSHLVGDLPKKLTMLASLIRHNNQFLKFAEKQTTPCVLGRLILYGPPGNGKSTMAETIAELGGAELFRIHGPSIVGRYIGQGVETIDKVFQQACDYADEHRQVAVIVIEEIDAIAGNNNTELRSEHSAALQKLWLLLDDYKYDPRIFVVCTTNHFETLHQAFVDRFGSNCIEVGNPDAAMRQKVLQHYFRQFSQQDINEDLLSMFVKKTDGMSIRCLEDLARDTSFAAYIENDSKITRTIATETLNDVIKKWKSQDSKKTLNYLEFWRPATSIFNDITLTVRNMCFLYILYSSGSSNSIPHV